MLYFFILKQKIVYRRDVNEFKIDHLFCYAWGIFQSSVGK